MTRRLTIALVTLALASLAFAGENHHMANAPASPAFERMKALVGDWKATIPGMGDVTATYSLHSDGSALLEEMKVPGEPGMITVYYSKGNDIAMTHYCSGHNQPHMVAKGDAQNLSFAMVSVDNLPSNDAEHMAGVSFAFKDPDHFTATWTNIANGKETPVPFNFTRVH